MFHEFVFLAQSVYNLSLIAPILAGRLPVRLRQLGENQVGRGIHTGCEDESPHGVREEGRQGFKF